MFEVTKDEDFVYVKATVSRRKFSSEKRIYIKWVHAFEEAKKRYPEVDILRENDNHDIVSTETNKNSSLWKFKIVKKEIQIEEKLPINKNIFKNKKLRRLTKQAESVTVEETEQSLSDQPVIVQESTE